MKVVWHVILALNVLAVSMAVKGRVSPAKMDISKPTPVQIAVNHVQVFSVTVPLERT